MIQYLKAIKILNGKEMNVRRFKVLHIPLTKKEANLLISSINYRYIRRKYKEFPDIDPTTVLKIFDFKRCYLDLSETK